MLRALWGALVGGQPAAEEACADPPPAECPTLRELCLATLAEHAESIPDLDFVPDALVAALLAQVEHAPLRLRLLLAPSAVGKRSAETWASVGGVVDEPSGDLCSLTAATDAAAVRALLRAAPPSLTALDLGGSSGLGEDVGAALLRALPRLRSLGLAHVPLGDAGVAALAAQPALRTLERLDLCWCGAGLVGARALAAALADTAVLVRFQHNLGGADVVPAVRAFRAAGAEGRVEIV